MGRTTRPPIADLERIAARQPSLLNVLVAYFVFEWRSAKHGVNQHGEDQTEMVRRVPNYVEMWGVDTCVHFLRLSPLARDPDEEGFLSEWLKSAAYPVEEEQ